MRGRSLLLSAAVLLVTTVSYNAGVVAAANGVPSVVSATPAATSTTAPPVGPATTPPVVTVTPSTPSTGAPPAVVPSTAASSAGPARQGSVSAEAGSVSAPAIIASYSGRLLNLQSGFVFFASGDAFHSAPDAAPLNSTKKIAFEGDEVTGLFGKAEFSADGVTRILQIDTHAFPAAESGPSIVQFAVSKSQKSENPELADGGNGFTGAPVLVSFTVTVPPTTPLTGYVYLTTEGSRWNPQEIRMDRVDALHYRITRSIA